MDRTVAAGVAGANGCDEFFFPQARRVATLGGPIFVPHNRVDIICVIGSAAQALWSLAAIAPRLGIAELRVAIHLATIADPRTHAAAPTERDIQQGTRVDRKNIRAVLRSLVKKHLITMPRFTCST